MIDNTYNRFMIWSAEGRRRKFFDSDDETVDDNNPLFGRINGATICVISIHVTSTKKSRKNRDGKDTQYLLQASARSAGRRRHMCVRIVQTYMPSKMKYGSATISQTVPVLHSMCIAHATFSEKYIRIKSYYIYLLCHPFNTFVDTSLMFFYVSYSMFSTCKMWKTHTPRLRVMATSIEGKVRYNRH